MGSDGGTGTSGTATKGSGSTSVVSPGSDAAATGASLDAASATGISVSVSPSVEHMAPGATAQFEATVKGSSDNMVSWTVEEGASGGSISTSGLYTAPSSPGTFHVIAQSHADATANGSATVFVNTVGNCSNLPAAGTWESIWPMADMNASTFSSGFSEALVVDPFDPATVWFGVGYQGIYKSTDCGATWAHVNTGRNGTTMSNGSPLSMAVDPVDQGTIYTVSLFSTWGLWKSTNGGVDWDNLFPQGSDVYKATNSAVDSISMDRNNHLHLVVGFHTNCNAPYAPTCEAVTTDGGKTWTIVKTPNAAWEEGAGPWILDATSWLYGGSDLWLTTDSGGTWNKVTPSGTWAFSGGEVETHPIPQGADGTYYLTSSQGMTRSTDGHTWTLIPNFTKRVVGFASGDGHFFSSDQWSNSYYSASSSNPATWSSVPPPAALPSSQGAPYLDYDAAHHILYSSNYGGGMWRVVMP